MPSLNQPEKTYLNKSQRKLQYESETMPIIEVDSVYELGKLTALSFIDWVSQNPNGVVALPTGKTPELFIKFLTFYKSHWQDEQVQTELNAHGITLDKFPDLSELRFVQLDEFYPISPNHKRSFTQFVRQYYLNILEIKPENALLIDIASQGILKQHGVETVFPDGRVDLTLLERPARNELEQRQKQALNEAVAFCKAYEEKITALGGIGFFLGGIGYDGHVAFNQPGSTKDSTTRLVELNYPSSAQASVDLGGMYFARNKTAITIGLKTITIDPNAKIVISAAGEGKASILQKTIESKPSADLPISQLNKAKIVFYLTKGAASALSGSQIEKLSQITAHFNDNSYVQQALIDIAIAERKSLADISSQDLARHTLGQALLKHPLFDLEKLKTNTRQSLINKIEGSDKIGYQKSIMHTAPHHDDIMLSYYGYIPQLLQNSTNHFVYVTSGFNSVTDHYIVSNLNRLRGHHMTHLDKTLFQTNYKQTLDQFSKAHYPEQKPLLDNIDAMILGKKLIDIYQDTTGQKVQLRSHNLAENYFRYKTPGQIDDQPIKILKGAMRESEVDRLWHMNHVDLKHVYHMRSKFYTGEDFNPLPSIEHDAKPITQLLTKLNPDIITVALDPEGTGPDTHYKVLQVIAQAMTLWPRNENVSVWGYRNVWYRFKLTDANQFIPISAAELAKIDHDFSKCFYTQKRAEFPSPEFDGRFSMLSIKIQKEQAQYLKLLLGKAYFDNHPNPRIRQASGFLLFKSFDKQHFLEEAHIMQDRFHLDSVFARYKNA